MSKVFKPISHILHDNTGELGALVARAAMLSTLNTTILKQLETLVDPKLLAKIQVLNYRDNTLVFGSKNPYALTLLRFQNDKIIQHLRNLPELRGLTALLWRVWV